MSAIKKAILRCGVSERYFVRMMHDRTIGRPEECKMGALAGSPGVEEKDIVVLVYGVSFQCVFSEFGNRRLF